MRIFRMIAASVFLAAIAALSAFAQGTARPAPTRTQPTTPAPARPQTTTPAAPTATGAAAVVPDTKIAFINTEAFSDEKAGIVRYVNAAKALEKEFKPRQDELIAMNNRLKTLADEIQKLSGAQVVSQQSIQQKQDEAEQLQRDMKRKKEDAEDAYQKRYQVVVGPISQDIGKALDTFAQSRGITMILDISKLVPAGIILTANPATDVTQAFITEYNSTHPATASIQ